MKSRWSGSGLAQRAMLGVSLRDQIRNEAIRQRTKATDLARWSSGLAISAVEPTTAKRVLEWRPRLGKHSVGRPQAWWSDDLRKRTGRSCMRVAEDRAKWWEVGEGYVQQWTVIGWWWNKSYHLPTHCVSLPGSTMVYHQLTINSEAERWLFSWRNL
jgi:hypothetical protein